MVMARPDVRNHRSLADENLLEWLGRLTTNERNLLNALMLEADDFADQDLVNFCRRHIRLGTGIGGKQTNRAELMAQVAMHDESLRQASERQVPEAKGDIPKGP